MSAPRWTPSCPAELPCPVASCRYHLPAGPGCALAAAEEGPHTLEDVGELIGVGRERARVIEEKALRKVRLRLPMFGVDGGR